ncbi:MAG: DUF1800 domain-containing protein [Acidobacteria bacterium]|nr:DUF1800 domain-containing protein [Acidobacteriota bacterium]
MSSLKRTILSPAAAVLLLPMLVLAYSTWRPVDIAAAAVPTDDRTVEHVLNRLGYGARPGVIEKVRQTGITAYIEQQLHPERIDDSALEARLAPLKTLELRQSTLAREYFIPAQQERRRQQRAQGQGDPEPPDPNSTGVVPRMDVSPAMLKARQVMVELNEQKLLRATYSERQLEEVLADFWFNHFNVYAAKGADRQLLTAYERDAIRPNVLGNFRTLLGATAHSPAMLFYLDNWMSTDPNGRHLTKTDEARQRNRARLLGVIRPDLAGTLAQRQNRRPTGLNENYGRELMELHTLGVDGGYTQQDVVEVARALTGWTIDRPRLGGAFTFDPRMHDPGEKHVLGHTIKAGGGEHDGEQVLDILASHPSTAAFIATKLARRFVSDQPPPALIDRAAKRFLDTKGDIREVVRTIVESPEFFAPAAQRAKVKTPFEFVVSALRASSAEVRCGLGLIRALQQLGMPLYQAQAPTGYSDTADAWVNTGGLVSRINFAVSLVDNRVPGVRLDPARTTLTALQLGSPEFQKK